MGKICVACVTVKALEQINGTEKFHVSANLFHEHLRVE